MVTNGKKSQTIDKHKKKILKINNKMKWSWKNILLYGFLILFTLFIFAGLSGPYDDRKNVAISQVIDDVKKGKVTEITVTGDKIVVKEKDNSVIQTYKESGVNVYTLFKDAGVPLKNTKVAIKDETTLNNWLNILSAVLPVALMIAFFYFIFRQARGTQESIFSFGQSRAKLFNKDNPKVSFSDVAGVDEAKQELTEIVDFLKNPGKYKAMGARTPKGVLMVGPSGTGKTLLARATAGEANTAFFSMAGSEFMEMLVGVGASRVRDLFNTAKKAQPAIIFIDEVDAIGRQRGVGIMGGHDEREQTLNQILVEMDGFTPNEQLVVMAASVTGDTPILVKNKGEVRLMPIGEFIDGYYRKVEEGEEKVVDGIETLGFEKTNDSAHLTFQRPAFKKVRSVFRHKVNEIFEIEYTGGKAQTTGNHSVFVRSGKHILAKAVTDIRPGDILIDFPYKLPFTYQRNKNYNNLHNTFQFDNSYSLTLPIYLTDEKQEQLARNYFFAVSQSHISQATIGQQIGVSQTTVGYWKRSDRMPRLLSKAYFKHALPDQVKVTPDLMRLMGYYVAEGYSRKEIDFCFNKNETVLIEDVIYLMEHIFLLRPQAIRIRGNAANITYQSRPLATFFAYHCGKGARNKHLPSFLFNAPREYYLEFLRGVFEGDGYQDKRGKGEITSVSKQLILELNWLCRLHGIKTYIHTFIAKEGRVINNGKPLKATVAYRLGFGKMANPFSGSVKQYGKFPKVMKITKKPFNGYVYDLCGCENEAFFGGESPILLHNTNRPDVLDPALVRPGRFDRRVVLDLPDVEGRKAILAIHAKGKPFEKDVNWEKVAKRTVGFSGADLENMLNEAAILAARLGKKQIDMEDLEEAATKVKLGPEKKQLQSEDDRRMTAYHEAGHALVSWEMPHMDPIHRISIVRRGMALGHTMMEPIERTHETKTHLLEEIAVMMGGRAAEQLVFNEMTTGASNDIEKATQVARAMVAQFGMSDLGPINLDGEKRGFYEQPEVSSEMAARIDQQVKKITDAAYASAQQILTKLRDKLDLLAKELLIKETLESEQFTQLIGPKNAVPVPVKA